jgi:hypothetical protein
LLLKNNNKLNARQLKRAKSNKVTLKYATLKKRAIQMVQTGEVVIQKYKQVEYWNDKPDVFFNDQ